MRRTWTRSSRTHSGNCCRQYKPHTASSAGIYIKSIYARETMAYAVLSTGEYYPILTLEELDQLPYYCSLCQAIKAFINLVQCDRRAEELVHWQFARQVQVDQAWNIAEWYG